MIADPVARLGNRLVACAGDPLEARQWRPARIADVLAGPLSLAGLARAATIDLGPMAGIARAALGDLLTEASEIGRGLPGRTIALAIAGDAVVVAPPYVEKGGATAGKSDGRSLVARFGRVSDGTPTGVLSVKPLSADGRSPEGGLILTIRKPRTVTAEDLSRAGLTWDDVIASALSLDARDKRGAERRAGDKTWLEVAVATMESLLQAQPHA